MNTYLNSTYYNSLNSTAQSQIVSKDFSIGAVDAVDNNLLNTINDENSKKWNGKVALATASEYVKSNSNQGSCGNMYQVSNSSSCGNTTWMHNSTIWWTLSSSSIFYTVFSVIDNGSVIITGTGYLAIVVRPTITLSSEVQITGGDVSQSNPYTNE